LKANHRRATGQPVHLNRVHQGAGGT
jgi:hypothetical protein